MREDRNKGRKAREAFNPPRALDLLRQAVEMPGTLSADYRQFYHYSIYNRMLIRWQCDEKGIEYGPIATYRKWQELGRRVVSGPGSAMAMAVPYTFQPRDPTTGEPAVDEDGNPVLVRRYKYPYRWFVLCQTEGDPLPPLETESYDTARALAELDIEVEDFAHGDGNVVGYATARRTVAINPVSHHHMHTLLHEVAHIVLGHLEGGDGDLADGYTLTRSLKEFEAEAVAYIVASAIGTADESALSDSRGYIQAYYGQMDAPDDGRIVSDETASRILGAADTILRAGRHSSGDEGEGDSLEP